ncbi:unnamed protein product, partial [Rotaria socialis]
ETDSPDEEMDMDSANGNDREPQHRILVLNKH